VEDPKSKTLVLTPDEVECIKDLSERTIGQYRNYKLQSNDEYMRGVFQRGIDMLQGFIDRLSD
jgi:hypothetical protein